jgi:hypothetical protein
MVSHTLKLVILGEKLTLVKKIIAGGQTTVDSLAGRQANRPFRHMSYGCDFHFFIRPQIVT